MEMLLLFVFKCHNCTAGRVIDGDGDVDGARAG